MMTIFSALATRVATKFLTFLALHTPSLPPNVKLDTTHVLPVRRTFAAAFLYRVIALSINSLTAKRPSPQGTMTLTDAKHTVTFMPDAQRFESNGRGLAKTRNQHTTETTVGRTLIGIKIESLQLTNQDPAR
jgi:hypothetical protein